MQSVLTAHHTGPATGVLVMDYCIARSPTPWRLRWLRMTSISSALLHAAAVWKTHLQPKNHGWRKSIIRQSSRIGSSMHGC